MRFRIGARRCVRISWNAPAPRPERRPEAAKIFQQESASMSVAEGSPLTKTYQPVTWNFKLLAHDMLGGFGGMGEGMSVQIAPAGRRRLLLGRARGARKF